jgi:hypothetical protein
MIIFSAASVASTFGSGWRYEHPQRTQDFKNLTPSRPCSASLSPATVRHAPRLQRFLPDWLCPPQIQQALIGLWFFGFVDQLEKMLNELMRSDKPRERGVEGHRFAVPFRGSAKRDWAPRAETAAKLRDYSPFGCCIIPPSA